jgi:nickel superoxide dismutase
VIYKITSTIDKLVNLPSANAHCDIPCKIYDPAIALIAAASVVRLMDIMKEASEEEPSLQVQNTIARCVFRKEEEAEKVKQEVRVIWGDYFKDPHMKEFPEIHGLTHQIMMKASACKQEINRSDGEDLSELVNKFAEIFWKTKEIKTVRRNSPNLPNLETVYPNL